MTRRPDNAGDMTLAQLLDDWRAKKRALTHIAEACEAVGDKPPPDDFVWSVAKVARKALGE